MPAVDFYDFPGLQVTGAKFFADRHQISGHSGR